MPPVIKPSTKGLSSQQSARRQYGLFMTFEGIEGSGKSTQCRLLAQYLEDQGIRVVETREPGGTPVGESIRDIFLHTTMHPSDSLTPETESSLVFAARSQHVASLLLPALYDGAVVLCDRFSDSTLAYQGYGRGLTITSLQRLNRFATHGLTPDMTFVFDLPVRQGLIRRQRTATQNRLDKEALAFHARVRHGFLQLARQHPRRITLMNARRSEEALSKHIRVLVEPILKRRLRSQQISHTREKE